ncbi:MAG TPA: hypothetical protein VNA88_01485 [Candidatus Kapabacteria bacterium]|nr:hypothetical protein [Candidatus Kapabacteria bacterium]
MPLSDILGIRLVIWTGRSAPMPAPPEVVEALARVEITNDAAEGDGFQMTFTLGRDLVDFPLLSGGALDPFSRIIVGVKITAIPEVLIDGVVTHHEIAPSNEPGMSTLTVTGRDVSAMLDLEERSARYDNQPDSLIVTQLVARYAEYGLVPTVTPTTDVPIVVQRTPWQQQTDLAFIRRIAERNGFVFFIEPLTFLANTAYWGPENRLGIPQPALSMNMGDATNVRSLRFTNDALAPVGTSSTVLEPNTGMSIPIPSLPSLRIPPLSAAPASPRRTVILRDTANQSAATAATRSVAAATSSPDPVRGEGELDAVRYGAVLRARRIVGVRGAGATYDGNYYVRRVTHAIDAREGSYTQRFSISREGTGALLPVVVP